MDFRFLKKTRAPQSTSKLLVKTQSLNPSMSRTFSKSGKPSWLRAKLPSGPEYGRVRNLVDDNQLHTVCQSAQCPNMGECWSRGTATLMILGNICTRACTFCAIQTGKPTELDLAEAPRVADAVAKMGLKHCVLTLSLIHI